MLVLTCRTDERIQPGDGITITVLSIQGNQIRLGIQASPEVKILRVDLVDRDRPLDAA